MSRNSTCHNHNSPDLPASSLVSLQNEHATARGAASEDLAGCAPPLPRVLACRCPYVHKKPWCVPTRRSRPQPASWLTPHSLPFHLTVLQTHWNALYFINEPVAAQQSWRWAARPFLFPVLWSIFVNNRERRHNTCTILFLTPHVRDSCPLQFTPPQGSAQMSLSQDPRVD